MNFSLVCTAVALVSLPFGLGFLFAPVASASFYAAVTPDPVLVLTGRYFGSETLMYAAAAWGLRGLHDARAQRIAAGALALATLSGIGVTLHGIASGTLNALGWTSVALYAGFAAAWAALALRRPAGGKAFA